MNKTIIGVDVDIVLAASDVAWWNWLCNVTGESKPFPDGTVHYNLTDYFENELIKSGRDGFDFWRATGVYDWVDPIPGSVAALQCLKHNLNCEIVAISHVKGHHHKNKWQWLKKWYGDHIDGFLATKEKHYVAVDWMIDDRNKYLNKMSENVKCIRLDTPYTQDQQPERSIRVLKNWKDIVDTIIYEGTTGV